MLYKNVSCGTDSVGAVKGTRTDPNTTINKTKRNVNARIYFYIVFGIFVAFNVIGTKTTLAQDMPENGVAVSGNHPLKGTSKGWDIESMQKDDNNFWIITCKQTLKWGQIEYQVDLASEEHLSEIRFKTDLVGWSSPLNFEVKLQYDDGTWSLVKVVKEGSQSLTNSIFSGMGHKKVRRLIIKEGQWGWFQMKVDYIYGVKR